MVDQSSIETIIKGDTLIAEVVMITTNAERRGISLAAEFLRQTLNSTSENHL